MINFILKDKIITLLTEKVILENIITQDYSYLLEQMKSIYIINDLIYTYYWKYELDKINPSKSDIDNISKINIEQLLKTINDYEHTQSKKLESELQNYTLKLKISLIKKKKKYKQTNWLKKQKKHYLPMKKQKKKKHKLKNYLKKR